jgi:uncharacterized OB-fold protein
MTPLGEMDTAAPYLKPLPTPTAANAPFWAALREHTFTVPKCADCGHLGWPPYPACRRCLSEQRVWAPMSGDAHIYSFSVVHRGHGAFNIEVPYGVVLAKLVEGPGPLIVLGNTVDVDVADLYIGMPLRIVFEDIADEDITLWRFAPRPEGQ